MTISCLFSIKAGYGKVDIVPWMGVWLELGEFLSRIVSPFFLQKEFTVICGEAAKQTTLHKKDLRNQHNLVESQAWNL